MLPEGGSGTARGGGRLGTVRLAAYEVIREVLDRHGAAEWPKAQGALARPSLLQHNNSRDRLLGFQSSAIFVFVYVIAVLVLRDLLNTTRIAMFRKNEGGLIQEVALRS